MANRHTQEPVRDYAGFALNRVRIALEGQIAAVVGGGGGAPVNDDTLTAVAGETLGGHRAVYLNDAGQALYADASLDTCRRTIGLTTGAAAFGATATLQFEGVLVNVGWTWTGNEPVWLAATGLLTQTVPTSGYLFRVGVPMGATKLRVDPLLVAKL